MKALLFRTALVVMLITAVLCLGLSLTPSPAWADGDASPTTGRFKVQVSGFVGLGLEDAILGTFSDISGNMTISGAGGVGTSITVGMAISSQLDFDVTVGTGTSKNLITSSKAEAKFERQYLLGTLKVKIPITTFQKNIRGRHGKLASLNSYLKLGLGGGLHSGTLTYDYFDLVYNNFRYYKIEYDPVISGHATAEYETFLNNNWSVVVGMMVTFVNLDVDTYTLDGVSYAGSSLTEPFKTLPGTGFDVFVGMARYF